MATLKDIAEHVGISITAASMALRDHHSISVATKRKVWAAQKALGYRLPLNPPESIAREVESSRPELRNIAFLLIDREYEGTAYTGGFHKLAERIAERMWRPVYLSARLKDLEAGVLPPLLVDGGFSGIVVSGNYNAQAHSEVTRLGLPIVVMGRYRLGEKPWSSCEPDFDHGADLFVSRVKSLGHRRIAFLQKEPANNYGSNLRQALFQAAGHEGLSVRHFADRAGVPEAPELTPAALLESKATVLLLSTGSLAPMALKSCAAAGLRVPGDISLVSFARPSSDYPDIAYIQPAGGMTRGLAAKLARLIEAPDTPHSRDLYPKLFVDGATLGPAPQEPSHSEILPSI